MAISSGAGTVFTWFSNMTSVAGLLTWFGISITYLRFYSGMKAQGINRMTLPFYTRVQPYAAWYGAIGTFIICLVSLVYYPGQYGFDIISVQRVERLPQGQMGHGNLRYELSPFHPIPYPIHRILALLPHPIHQGRGYGFRVRHRADRGG